MNNQSATNNFLFKQFPGWIYFSAVCLLSAGCSSLGHSGREEPLIAKSIGHISEITLEGDDNELSIAIEKELEKNGVEVHTRFAPEVRTKSANIEIVTNNMKTRFVAQVTSNDLDICMGEGSRQMHFKIVVTDLQEHKRVLVMNGEYGCKNSIVEKFINWLASGQRSPQ